MRGRPKAFKGSWVVAVEKQVIAAEETEPDRVALMERTLLVARLETLIARI